MSEFSIPGDLICHADCAQLRGHPGYNRDNTKYFPFIMQDRVFLGTSKMYVKYSFRPVSESSL